MLLSPLYFMVREMTKKHLAAINRGRKAAGLKPIRMKKKKVSAEKRAVSKVAAFQENRKERDFWCEKCLKKKSKKPLNPKSQKKVNRAMADLRKEGFSKIKLLFFEVLIRALTLRDYKLKENLRTKKAPY